MLQLALQRLDVILMAALRGPAEAALYTAATRLLVIGQMGGQSLSMAVQHRFSALLSRKSFAEANELYQMTTAWLIVMTWPIYLLWALFAYQVTGVFGHGYSSAGGVGVILALAMLVGTACGMVSMVLEMAGNTGIAFVQTAIALVANIVRRHRADPADGPDRRGDRLGGLDPAEQPAAAGSAQPRVRDVPARPQRVRGDGAPRSLSFIVVPGARRAARRSPSAAGPGRRRRRHRALRGAALAAPVDVATLRTRLRPAPAAWCAVRRAPAP